MSTKYETLLVEALRYEAEAFDDDTEVNGGDLVEWFAEWRQRVKAALEPPPANPVAQSPCEVTPRQLREAIDALAEAAETRRQCTAMDEPREPVNGLIADSYGNTAEYLRGVVRVLERDQAVLQPTPTVSWSSQAPNRFRNFYEHCGQEWTDDSPCTTSDKCPTCRLSIEPYRSEDLPGVAVEEIDEASD